MVGAIDPTLARAEIMAALQACAAREQAVEAAYAKSAHQGFELAAEENAEDYLPLPHAANPYQGTLEPHTRWDEVETPEGEDHWASLGKNMPDWAVAGTDGAAGSRKARG